MRIILLCKLFLIIVLLVFKMVSSLSDMLMKIFVSGLVNSWEQSESYCSHWHE
jgi:hypothetical protein